VSSRRCRIDMSFRRPLYARHPDDPLESASACSPRTHNMTSGKNPPQARRCVYEESS
jgi:hypothetical protein